MPMTPIKFVPYEMKASVVRFFSYEDKNPTGVLVNSYFGREMYFGSALSLLFLLDELQDSLKFPQESMLPRTFTAPEQGDRKPERVSPADDPQPIASFKINIMFRQNASWQGSIVWLDNSMESQFRSVLELLFLIDSVLEARQDDAPRQLASDE
jgi:hypothetical protein